jgi:hypothetical protein
LILPIARHDDDSPRRRQDALLALRVLFFTGHTYNAVVPATHFALHVERNSFRSPRLERNEFRSTF